MNREERVASELRKIAAASWVIAAISIVGLIVKPQYVVLWAFALSFSIATVPRWIWRRIQARRSQRHDE